jgi:hypothetical protein
MIEAALIVITPVKFTIDMVTPAIPIGFNPVAFLIQVALDPVALAIESFG